MTGGARPAQALPSAGDVWIVDLATENAALLAVHGSRTLLTEPERARADRFVDTRQRERWIAAHAALHIVLADRIGHPIAFEQPNVTTKPRVAGWSGDFSLTHTGELVLIAVRDDGMIGIDAEVRRPVRISTQRRELIEIAGAAVLPDVALPERDPDLHFLAAWTRLEAIAKLRATGIGALLEKLGIIANGPGADAVADHAHALARDPAQPIGLFAIDVSRFDGVATLAASPEASPPRIHLFSLQNGSLRG